jgi:hypothetical protein
LTKGHQFSSNSAQEDFKTSFAKEADGCKLKEWTNMLSQRRQKLGIRVNNFEKDLSEYISQIPDYLELQCARNCFDEIDEILTFNANNGVQDDGVCSSQLKLKPPYSVCCA